MKIFVKGFCATLKKISKPLDCPQQRAVGLYQYPYTFWFLKELSLPLRPHASI